MSASFAVCAYFEQSLDWVTFVTAGVDPMYWEASSLDAKFDYIKLKWI